MGQTEQMTWMLLARFVRIFIKYIRLQYPTVQEGSREANLLADIKHLENDYLL